MCADVARGRPRKLEHYRHDITGLFSAGAPYADILKYLREETDCPGGHVSMSTLQRRLKDWGMQRQQNADASPSLVAKIRILFLEQGLDDTQILHVLERDGSKIGLWSLRRIRLSEGLRRRYSAEEKQLLEPVWHDMIQEQLAVNRRLDGFGRHYLYTHFRKHGCVIPRDPLFKIYRELNPDAVARRRTAQQRRRREFIVPGPNFIWSIDGYDKLKRFGIEIYACIDAYSRYVLWVYVGQSNATSACVNRQFLDFLSVHGKQPQIIRSDRGGETPLLANSHYNLRCMSQPGLAFKDCYIYGTSVGNQRIEKWWETLSTGNLFIYREYFAFLESTGQFSSDSIVDQAALLALYMPIIREELLGFVEIWNSHTIRRQPNRPNHVAGRPWLLFFYPEMGVQDYGLNIDLDQVERLTQDHHFDKIDIDAFLDKPTQLLCQDFLREMGFRQTTARLDALEDRQRPFLTQYLRLRECLSQHVKSGSAPPIALIARPVGGYDWFAAAGGIVTGEQLADIEERDLDSDA